MTGHDETKNLTHLAYSPRKRTSHQDNNKSSTQQQPYQQPSTPRYKTHAYHNGSTGKLYQIERNDDALPTPRNYTSGQQQNTDRNGSRRKPVMVPSKTNKSDKTVKSEKCTII